MKTIRLRSADAFLTQDNRTVVASGWRVIQPESDGARVVFSGSKFRTVERPTLATVRAAFGEGKRAA